MHRFVRIRLLSGILLCGLIAACSGPDHQALLDEARAYYADGDARTAMIHLKNLLRAEPDNRAARLLRGEVALAMEDGFTAEKDLRRAEELGVARGDLVVMLGRSMMLQGAFDRVVADIHVGAATDQSARLDVLLLRGDAYLNLDKPDNAAKAFRDAMRLAPDSADAMVGLARVARRRDDLDTALTEIARAVSAGPRLPQVWRANGQIQLLAGNTVQARESFRKAIALKPVVSLMRDDYAVLSGLFRAHLALDEMDEALAVAELALEVGQGHPLAHYLLGQHALRIGDGAKAEAHFLKTLATYPNHLGALSFMGGLSLEQGKLRQAENYLRQAVILDNDDPRIRMQLAQTMLQLRQGDEALNVLAPVLREHGDIPELLTLAGRATAVSKDRDDWLSYYEQAAAADPANLRWQFDLAEAYISAGMADKSVEILQRIPASADTSDRRDLTLMEAHAQAGELDKAIAVANQLLTRHPGDTKTLIVLGRLHLAANDLTTARRHLEAVLNTAPANIPALLTLGQVEILAARFDEAESLFRQAYAIQPEYLPTAKLLVILATRTGDNRGAIEWLQAARLTNPEAIMPRVGLVALYLMEDDVAAAYRFAQEALALQPGDPRALTALGITQIRREEYKAAVETLQDAALAAPHSGMIQFELAKAQLSDDNRSDARRALNKSIALAPWNAKYAVAAAKLELAMNDAMRAGQIAQGLIANHPDYAVGYELLGKALMVLERYADADEAFAMAVTKGQKEEFAIQHYDALVQAGDQRAPEVLAGWLDDHPQDWRVRALLAQAHHDNGETVNAIEQYEQVLRDDPENMAAINNLAWLYLESDTARALEMAERAHKLRPNVGMVTDTLGWILVRQGQLDRGLALIRKAAQQAPAEAEIRYHLAAALVRIGEAEEARLLLTELINSGEAFAGDSEARELLKTL